MSDEKKRKKTYEPVPVVSPDERERYETMLAVLSGVLSVSDGARRVGLSRNHFQTLMHRGLKALAEGIAPKTAGRPGKPERQAQLEEELARTQRENERLRERVETIDRLLGVAGDFLRGQSGRPRERRSKPRATKKGTSSSDDDARASLKTATELRRLGLSWTLAASALGKSTRTLERWRAKGKQNRTLVVRRGPGPRSAPTTEATKAVEVLVRSSRGMIGAAALAHDVAAVSRRQAATIKHATLTRLERERVAACERVEITEPGVVRGFDAMHLRGVDGPCFALVAADAHVPYRTSVRVAARYDGDAVTRALEEDFEEHGAPLVLRLDRARCHGIPSVKAVLMRHKVLALHGPRRYPRYYGQLERQNREHRAWLDAGVARSRRQLATDWLALRELVNRSWRRPSLGWNTAEEIWRARPVIRHDRQSFMDEVTAREESFRTRGGPGDWARHAIEDTLQAHGLLRRKPGGHC